METIKNYLDNMFRAIPETAEMINLKSELLSHMEEKYTELKADGKSENEAIGIVISEFGNIDELLKEFDIPLENGESNNRENYAAQKVEPIYPEIRMEQATEYIETSKKTSLRVSIGVVLCMIGVASFLLINQLIDDKIWLLNMNSGSASFVGMIPLLVLVVIAVGLFISSGMKMEQYKYIDENKFIIGEHVKFRMEENLIMLNRYRTTNIVVGVALCILSPICFFVAEMIHEDGGTYGLVGLLLIVACAVFLFINSNTEYECCRKLLKEKEFSEAAKKQEKVIGAVASVVWPIAICIFFYLGFIRGDWKIAWVVFPITGLLFGGFSGAYSSMKSGE